jgi:hypothetical protein
MAAQEPWTWKVTQEIKNVATQLAKCKTLALHPALVHVFTASMLQLGTSALDMLVVLPSLLLMTKPLAAGLPVRLQLNTVTLGEVGTMPWMAMALPIGLMPELSGMW